MNPENYKTCPKCGVKRNIEEAPDCVICLDVKTLSGEVKVKKTSERAQQIYEMRRGNKENKPMTFAAIGRKMGISAQRVQQLTHY